MDTSVKWLCLQSCVGCAIGVCVGTLIQHSAWTPARPTQNVSIGVPCASVAYSHGFFGSWYVSGTVPDGLGSIGEVWRVRWEKFRYSPVCGGATRHRWQTGGPVAPMLVWMTAVMGGHGLVPNRSQDGRLRCELVIFFVSWGSWKWNPPATVRLLGASTSEIAAELGLKRR